jgi:hypothetical protein
MRQNFAFFEAIFLTTTPLLCLAAGQSDIDPDHKYAWSENVGWTNWHHNAQNPGDGVFVADTFLAGLMWTENVGWVSVGDGTPASGDHYANTDGSDFGVNIDGATGDLSGFGWSENVGWINFDTGVAAPNQARLDRDALRFRGYAWAENVGWINFDDSEHFVGVVAVDSIPAMSDWGMIVTTLLMVTAGTLVYARRTLRGIPSH